MQVGQQLADLHAMLGVRLADVLARQTRLQKRRFVCQLAQRLTVGGAQRIRHWQIGFMQHVEQFDEERHLLNRAALDQRQDELALLQADEVIGVFTTGSDALIVKQTAEPVRGEKCFQLGPSQWGKNGHIRTAND